MSELDSAIGEVRTRHLSARKEKNKVDLEALGPLLGDIETKQKATGPFDISTFYGIVRSHINGLKECMAAIEDLTDSAKSQKVIDSSYQVKLLNSFLPDLMSNAKMVEIASTFISECPQELGPRDMGRVMVHFKSNYPGQYDGKELSKITKDLLQSLKVG